MRTSARLFSLKAGDCFRETTRTKLFIILEEGASHYIVQDVRGDVRKMRDAGVRPETQEEFLREEAFYNNSGREYEIPDFPSFGD